MTQTKGNQALLSISEFAKYMNISETVARQLLKEKDYKFTVLVGKRTFIVKEKLDEYLKNCAENGVAF